MVLLLVPIGRCSHGFISENGFKEPNFAAAIVKAFTGCSCPVLYGTFKRLSWAESTTMQLHIGDASDSNTVIGRLSEMMATQTDAELEEAIPGVLDHMEGFRVQRKLRKNLTGALGPSVPVSCIRFILSFVDGECAKDGSRMVVQTAHTDGNGSHAGLHVCSAGDASCTVEYVTLGGAPSPSVRKHRWGAVVQRKPGMARPRTLAWCAIAQRGKDAAPRSPVIGGSDPNRDAGRCRRHARPQGLRCLHQESGV
jgi:hypothetical protein